MRSRGFNIIELMITVAIAGILALVGIPQMTQQVENARVRSVTNDLTTAVSLARSEAVRQSSDFRVQAMTTGTTTAYNHGWCVVPSDSNCSASNVRRVFGPPGNLTIDPDNDTLMFMQFDNQGAWAGGNEGIHIEPDNCTSGQERARRIEINGAGRPGVTRVSCL